MELIIAVVILFTSIVLPHEFGHFIVAKLTKVKVKKFSIGFGPALFKKKIGETEFALCLIPLGGYVKMLGEGSDDDVKESEIGRSFAHQSIKKRALIVSAGAAFNIIFALLLLIAIYFIGIKVKTPEIGSVEKGSPAEIAGIMVGDSIKEIDGVSIDRWDTAIKMIKERKDKPLSIVLSRDDQTVTTVVFPEKKMITDLLRRDIEIGYIGIEPTGDMFLATESFTGAVKKAFNKAYSMSELVTLAIVRLATGKIPLSELGGPVMIAKMVKEQLKIGVQNYLFMIAFLNINIGLFNFIPIPPLDGSRVIMGLLPAKLAYQYIQLERFGFIIIVIMLYLGLFQIIIWPIVLTILKLLA